MADEKKPVGYYELPDGYTGFLQYPNPVSYSAFKAWWETAVHGVKDLKRFEWQHWDKQWQAAKQMLVDYGKWEIEGITAGMMKDDDIPLRIQQWIVTTHRVYLWPQLDPKVRGILSGIFWMED